jgi:hypothetical protein
MDLRCFNPQFFIGSRVGDAALDTDEARRAGSYDRQLRIVIDAVRVLCAAVSADDLLPGDRLALDRLAELGQRADSVTPRDGTGEAVLTTADVDDLIQKLQRLRQEDPGSADEVVRRLTEEAGRPAIGTGTS